MKFHSCFLLSILYNEIIFYTYDSRQLGTNENEKKKPLSHDHN